MLEIIDHLIIKKGETLFSKSKFILLLYKIPYLVSYSP